MPGYRRVNGGAVRRVREYPFAIAVAPGLRGDGQALMASPVDAYAVLSPPARLVAQVYGVVAPHTVGVPRITKVLARAGISLLRRPLTEAEVRRCSQEIVDAGIGFRPARPAKAGICARPEWTVSLTSEAAQGGRLEPILGAFEATRASPRTDPFMYETLFRCYVVAGDFRNLDELIGGEAQPEDWRFLAEPLAVDVLARLPEDHVDKALSGCLRHVTETAGAAQPVIDACRHLANSPAVHAAEIALIEILKGRFQAAEEVFDALPRAARDRKPATTGRFATRALIATLRGDDLAARRSVDACLVAEKIGTRRRHVFPDHTSFAWALLSLVRLDGPEPHALLTQLLRTAERHASTLHDVIALVVDALCAKSGRAVYARGADTPCLEVLRDGLRYCWIGGHHQHGLDEWRPRLAAFRERAQANGYAWLAAECAAVQRRVAELAGDPGAGPDPAPLHAALGTRALTDLAAPVPVWERSLRALEQFAYDARSEKDQKRSGDAEPRKRLAWEIVEVERGIQPSPREQRETRGGGWSKGRRVALKRLAAEAETMDFLREEDLAGRRGDHRPELLGQSGIRPGSAGAVRPCRPSARLQRRWGTGGHCPP